MFDPTLLSEESRSFITEFLDAYDQHLEAVQLGVAIADGIWF